MVVAEKLDRTEGGQYGPDCQLLTFSQLCPLWHLKRNL
jgi:hypothetical protein